jgi:predicted metalloprotease with PDZ domain
VIAHPWAEGPPQKADPTKRRPLGALRLITTIGAVWLSISFAVPARATIRYDVSLAHPEQHLFHVTITVPDVTRELIVQMAAWNALYTIRDFASHVQKVEAYAGSDLYSAVMGPQLPVDKSDKQTWRIRGDGTITIRYAIYWDEAGPFGTQLSPGHAFVNPAMVLMYVPDRRTESVFLSLDAPLEWEVQSAGLTGIESMGRARRFLFELANYDALADSPIEAGTYQEFTLPGISPEVRVVVHGDSWHKARMQDELTRICKYELQLMGGAPFDHYTFIFHIGHAAAGAGGGMEHANSTAINIPSDEFLPDVAAHEFFHLWNVKRIRPASLEPIDYTKEQYTRALWFAEGVTSTYSSYTLERTGIWTKQQLYDQLGNIVAELERRPANKWQSAEESSLDAWFEKYPLYDEPDYSVSYYTKGEILGVLLDLLIRDRTNNAKSLDDLMRAMNTDFAKAGKTYRDSIDIRLEAEKIAGGSFEDFFTKYVAHADAVPYVETFALAGLDLRKGERKYPALGFFAERDAAGNLGVRTVEPDSLAASAGLQPNDVILQWNGAEPARRPERWLRNQHPGDILRLKVRREGRELDVQFPLGETTELFYQVAEDIHSSEKARRIREGWLHGTVDGAL